MRSWKLSPLAASVWLVASAAQAATLPDIAPLDVIEISDEVNPNNLTPAQLTQPGDISAALNAKDSGVPLRTPARSYDSQCVDDGLARLQSETPPDVLIYFAHRAARSCANADVQPAFTQAVERLLQRGGGVVVFHHGLYTAAGKGPILQLIGAQSNSIAWNTMQGQRVVAIARSHFVASNGIKYDGKVTLPAFSGVPAGEYDAFVNVPDERYPVTDLLDVGMATRTVLFASDSGGNRVLGFVTARSEWKGKIVAYQPGEYQPNALDQRDGNNFQILANAIAFSAGRVNEKGEPVTGAGGSSGSGGSGAGGNAGSGGANTAQGGQAQGGGASGGRTAGGGTATSGGSSAASGGAVSGGVPSAASGAAASGGAAALGGSVAGGNASTTSGGAPGAGGSTVAAAGAAAGPAESTSGCGCGVARQQRWPSLLVPPLMLGLLWRRRALRARSSNG